MAIELTAETGQAITQRRPLVALESAYITHGLPWPVNYRTALEAEQAVRDAGAVPATIALIAGRIQVGLLPEQLAELAQTQSHKASARDIAALASLGAWAGTTVAGTLRIAGRLGHVRVMATGGIGGAHPYQAGTWDISADLSELSRVPLVVVCCGPKSFLDLHQTWEFLETLSVPVLGWRTEEMPAFYMRTSGIRLGHTFESLEMLAQAIALHWRLGGRGVLVVQLPPHTLAYSAEEWQELMRRAQPVLATLPSGPQATPAWLAALAGIAGQRLLDLNRQLIVANAQLAAQLATQIAAISVEIAPTR
ncbi:MAG: pseudouridine-5-phosphate glycosidase [Gemmataceae bacterium]